MIIDYGSAFVSNRKEIESKGVQFPGQDAPDKISGGGLSAVVHNISKICGFEPQEHQDWDAFWRTRQEGVKERKFP